MQVKDLIEKLSLVNPNTIIVMSSDSEGNNYSPLSDLFLGKYEPETAWSGHVYDSREDDVSDLEDAIVLEPMN